jgi:hypothetical protein
MPLMETSLKMLHPFTPPWSIRTGLRTCAVRYYTKWVLPRTRRALVWVISLSLICITGTREYFFLCLPPKNTCNLLQSLFYRQARAIDGIGLFSSRRGALLLPNKMDGRQACFAWHKREGLQRWAFIRRHIPLFWKRLPSDNFYVLWEMRTVDSSSPHLLAWSQQGKLCNTLQDTL